MTFDAARLARLDKHFARYVDDGRLPGWQLALTHKGDVVHECVYGWRDREANLPVEPDTIWRIASMTKPVVSVAAMTLWEEGVFELSDPISKWIPSFADARVYQKGVGRSLVTTPAAEPVRVWHLFTHTSGLTAGFLYNHVVDAMYRDAGYEFGAPPHPSIAECVEDWARLPLLFEPGSAWGYGVSHDVLGRLVEIWSGQSLDAAIDSRVCAPLGMRDTAFWCDESRGDRLAALYAIGDDDRAVRVPAPGVTAGPPAILSGGGGLISTAADYSRFARMLGGGGAFDGTRLLSPRTVALMTQNHLAADLGALSTGGFAETTFDGVGFGLGVAVNVDPIKQHSVSNPGEFFWGGVYSTAFWVDPVDDVTCVFMTQLMPSGSHPIRSQLRQMVYAARV
ncbi:MAG TPA: serine hydrolase domain-containing protein [Acidimicrobiales bacterium]|nr:serine hydrolase domain-containing protein [Acidimicrobiales bacterium]